MNNKVKHSFLIGFFIVAAFFAGCIPEDSLEWSQDGSVGLLRVDGALYFVDGQSGELTEIAKENVQPWPDISKDGSLAAYSREVFCDNLSEGLKLLPPGQVKKIKYNAEKMSESISKAGGLTDGKFPACYDELLNSEDYGNWAIRYMCENADGELLKVLGEEGIKSAREKTLRYFELVTVSRNKLEEKRVIASNIFLTVSIRISPDKRYAAYIMYTPYGGEDMEYSLYVASLSGEIKNALVDQRVALGYDWRKDSKAIAYLKADTDNLGEDELALGTLQERIISETENKLLAESIELDKKDGGSVEIHQCSGEVSSLAGMVFYPWQKVRYGLEGRIFFSTCDMPLPISKSDEPGWSLFCHDSATGMVTNVLPSSVSGYTSQALSMLQFELSPDFKSVLLPIKNNRLIDYQFGTDKVGLPVFDNEGFGEEEISTLVPTFKGDNEITFLVSEDSHYLAESERQNPDRYEIIVLDRKTLKGRILSRSWPDEIMDSLKD
ncbi:MAG: hypothetical protein JW715_12245 [Sedimentisphaerales bacterium]|nr:hypothetical protein [Sedimentisphaerales bacterium]